MTARNIKTSVFTLQPKTSLNVLSSLSVNSRRRYYLSNDGPHDKLLELQVLDNLSDIEQAIYETNRTRDKLINLLVGDVQSEILTLIDDPLERKNEDLPDADVIQLRHIEVLPAKYSRYRQWRDRTIFDVVRSNRDIIKSFGAYHSVVSTRPGVTFIAAVDKQNQEQFHEAFTNRHYADILVQAGSEYIIGGTEQGLNTHYFKSIDFNPLSTMI